MTYLDINAVNDFAKWGGSLMGYQILPHSLVDNSVKSEIVMELELVIEDHNIVTTMSKTGVAWFANLGYLLDDIRRVVPDKVNTNLPLHSPWCVARRGNGGA